MPAIEPVARKLDLSGNTSLTSLLHSKEFSELTEPELSQLTVLSLRGCGALTSLQGIEKLTALTHLDLFECESLTSSTLSDSLSLYCVCHLI